MVLKKTPAAGSTKAVTSAKVPTAATPVKAPARPTRAAGRRTSEMTSKTVKTR